MRSSILSSIDKEKRLNSTVIVNPQHTSRVSNYISNTPGVLSHNTTIPFNSGNF